MQPFSWPVPIQRGARVLCLGSHCDDIEIGCGGTLLRLLAENQGCHVDWIVFSSTSARRREALTGARLFLQEAKSSNVVIHRYRDGFFPYLGGKIKDEFERMKGKLRPDLIFTHGRGDLHQDHRLINELTWNTWRNHMILEYEIPKYDGDLGSPNLFVPLDQGVCRKKVTYLHQAYRSQAGKHWFAEETFLGLLRLRGVESAAEFAEAFYARKILV